MSGPAGCEVIGRWRIVASDLWDRDYLDLAGGNYQVDVPRSSCRIASELKGSSTWPAPASTFATRSTTMKTPPARIWKRCCGLRVRTARAAASGDRITKLAGKSTRPGVYKCKDCRKPF